MPTMSQERAFLELMQSNAEVKMSTASLDEAIDWIKNNLKPDDVFDNKELESWAESNGYIQE
jgi:hypothetical protein